MPTRANPFYRYQTPAGQTLSGLASAMFPDQGVNAVRESAAAENMAQARASDALAGYRGEQTRGERNLNDALMSNPGAIAELLLGGGVLKDDPMRSNPDYKPAAPIDFAGLFTNPGQISQAMQSPIVAGPTAQDKMAAAIQEATIRKIKLDDLLKAAGIAGYQSRINSANPDSALGYAPFAGVTSPNAGTALTPQRQDAISARDAAEDVVKQETINRTSITQEGMRQAGANTRNQYTVDNRPVTAGNNVDVIVTPAQGKALGLSPNADGQYVVRGRSTVSAGQDQQPGTAGGETVAGRERGTGTGSNKTPAVPVAAAKRMESFITRSLEGQNIELEPGALAGLVSEAGVAWQQSKNPDKAADDVVQRLMAGETISGVSLETKTGMLRDTKKAVRTPGGNTVTPPSAAIEYLRANPGLRDQFEAKYGKGSAAQYLKK